MVSRKIICGAFCLIGILAGMAWGQEAKPNKTLDELIHMYLENNRDSQSTVRIQVRQQLASMGQPAMDAIFDAIEGKLNKGAGGVVEGKNTPPRRPLDERRPTALLPVAEEIDAPLPVDRLCRLVEIGSAKGTALRLLSITGHDKALAYLEQRRDQIKDSFSDQDRDELTLVEADVQRWHAAREYIERDVIPDVKLNQRYTPDTFVLVPYSVDKPTHAMQLLYKNDPACLKWDGKIDLAYLEKRYQAILAESAGAAQGSIVHSGSGEFFEAYLAPKLLAWLNGDHSGLEAAGGRWKNEVEMLRTSTGIACNHLILMCDTMTSPTALEIKLKLMHLDKFKENDYASALERHDPALWINEYLAECPPKPDKAYLPLRILARQQTPLTAEELKALATILTTPKLSVPEDRKRPEENILKILADRYPQLFQKALKAKHLNAPVVNVIIENNLCDDETLLLDRIEYAMQNDYIIDFSKMSPERRAKLPPAALARMKGGINAPPQLRIGNDWLDLLAARFKDSNAAYQILQRFKNKGGLTPASEKDINKAVEKMLAAHPEWKGAGVQAPAAATQDK